MFAGRLAFADRLEDCAENLSAKLAEPDPRLLILVHSFFNVLYYLFFKNG